MLRGLIKTGAAYALRWTGTSRLTASLSGKGHAPLILGYHRVVEDVRAHLPTSIPAMLISRSMLERHLDWIGRRYRIVSLDEIGNYVESGLRFDRPVAAVTFDDGYADVYHNAFPLLRKKGIPAAVFVVSGLMGSTECFVHDKLYLLLSRRVSREADCSQVLRSLESHGLRLHEVAATRRFRRAAFDLTAMMLDSLNQEQLRRAVMALEGDCGPEPEHLADLQPLEWEMLREMQGAGMTIGSHTRTHALLTNESRPKLLLETTDSRRDLERELGVPIRHFAYPDGRFDEDAVEAVHGAGYAFGYTICRHRDPRRPLLTIPRTMLWENSCLDALGRFSSAMMGCQVDGVFGFASQCGSRHTRLGPSDPPADQDLICKAG